MDFWELSSVMDLGCTAEVRISSTRLRPSGVPPWRAWTETWYLAELSLERVLDSWLETEPLMETSREKTPQPSLAWASRVPLLSLVCWEETF